MHAQSDKLNLSSFSRYSRERSISACSGDQPSCIRKLASSSPPVLLRILVWAITEHPVCGLLQVAGNTEAIAIDVIRLITCIWSWYPSCPVQLWIEATSRYSTTFSLIYPQATIQWSHSRRCVQPHQWALWTPLCPVSAKHTPALSFSSSRQQVSLLLKSSSSLWVTSLCCRSTHFMLTTRRSKCL